ncbi:hypothetical protein F7725_017249 [Dissostichus mawsoni]|uniref:BAAT/Acyl-CoA thioester hydrolase C-terminal domain-containing protein n=1 Tax=Dissostichus mawsoni TaxID=36200 RepID=A0A7J5Z4K9_DISMA|nr:hypothetical protein F7725_017249 [Dissostichus mawsoni]
MAPGVRRIEIRQNGIVGTLFLPPGEHDFFTFPTKCKSCNGSCLATWGYASFSLAYIGHKDLPGPQNRINVGDPYFNSAFQLLQDHPQVYPDRIGIIGLSFGVYLTLRLASHSGIKPSCLICINGPAGSTIKLTDADGKTEQMENDQKYWTYDDQGNLEHLTCPLMYIVGEDDLSASSIENANLIEETLSAAGKSQLFTRLSYPGAGHLIEPPYTPNSRASLWSVKPQKRKPYHRALFYIEPCRILYLFSYQVKYETGYCNIEYVTTNESINDHTAAYFVVPAVVTLWGGHLAPHAAAQEDSWKKILEFMETNLRH